MKTEMKIFIDCEYNGMGGQLISMALVPMDEKLVPFYKELVIYEPIESWVSENVIPHLSQFAFDHTYSPPCDRSQFQAHLMLYLNQFDKIHLIADWPDDIKYFCDLLIIGPGARINTPELLIEIRRDLDSVSLKPHHSLSDAVAIRNKYIQVESDGQN